MPNGTRGRFPGMDMQRNPGKHENRLRGVAPQVILQATRC